MPANSINMAETERGQKYAADLAAMKNEDFAAECERKIWLAAYAANNPNAACHWQVDACYDESQRRDGGKSYQRASKAISRRGRS